MFVESMFWMVLLGKLIDLAVWLALMIFFAIACVLLLFDIFSSSSLPPGRHEFYFFSMNSLIMVRPFSD